MSTIWFWFLLLFVAAEAASCPKGCSCADNYMVCSCTSGNKHFQMKPFTGLSYMRSVFITDCAQVRLHSHAFKSMAITDKIVLKNINKLFIDAKAFSMMSLYPNTIEIATSNITVLQENSFTGITNVTNLWIRGCSIGRIEPGAFKGISNIDYVYIRECHIHELCTAALGGITQIQHLFVRGQVIINRMNRHVMKDSEVHTVVFKDVLIRDQHAHAFAGLAHFDTLQISNCTVLKTDLKGAADVHATTGGRKVQLHRVVYERLVVAGFANVEQVEITESHIDRLSGLAGVPIYNVSLLHFKNTHLNHLDEAALSAANNIEHILFEGCVIDTFHSRCMADVSAINRFTLCMCKVKRIEMHAFVNAQIRQVIIEEMHLSQLQTNSFQGLRSSTFRMRNMQSIDHIATAAYSGITTDLFELSTSRINSIDDYSLQTLNARHDVNLSSNTFTQDSLTAKAFAGFSTQVLYFSANKFACSCQDEFGWLDLLSSASQPTNKENAKTHYQASTKTFQRIGINFCSKSSDSPQANFPRSIATFHFLEQKCRKFYTPPSFVSNGLSCKIQAYLVICNCANKGSASITFQQFTKRLPVIASRLRITDCNNLHVHSNAFHMSNFTYLLASIEFTDCNGMILETDAFRELKLLRQLHFRNVQFKQIKEKSLVHLTGIELLSFVNCEMDSLPSKMLSKCVIQQLRFEHCHMKTVRAQALADSRFHTVNMTHCSVENIGADLFQNNRLIRHLSISNSRIDQFSQMGLDGPTPTSVCFESNTIDCECSNQAVRDLLAIDMCQSESNLCHLPQKHLNQSVQLLMDRKSLFRKACGDPHFREQNVKHLVLDQVGRAQTGCSPLRIVTLVLIPLGTFHLI